MSKVYYSLLWKENMTMNPFKTFLGKKEGMADDALEQVRETANRVGAGDPKWLHAETAPEFVTAEAGEDGPELLLLHGLLGAMSNWDTILPMFGDYSRPIALKFPLLEAHRSEVKVLPLALYTECFIRSRGIAPVAICGNSLGGHVALRTYLACPELVDCLILTGTSGLYEHSVDVLPVRPDRTYLRDHMHRVFHNDRFVTEEAIEDVYQVLTSRVRVLNLIHAARSAKKDNLLTLLGEVKVPTLLLWGEDDQITTMDVAEMFHKHIPGSELVTIKNCGHAPMIEHPEWFAEQVKTFLKKHSRL